MHVQSYCLDTIASVESNWLIFQFPHSGQVVFIQVILFVCVM